MTTEASIMTSISDLQQISMEDLAVFTAAIEAFIDEIAAYHGVVVSELTQANIEEVLSLLVVPFMISTDEYMDETNDTEVAIRALIPEVSQVLMNAIAIEGDVFTALDGMSFSAYINETLGFDQPVELGSALAFIHLFDTVLTPTNELLITDSIDLLFTNILGDATLQALLAIDPVTLVDVRTQFEAKLDEFIAGVHAFGLLDPSTLTFEQQKAIMVFADDFNIYFNNDMSQEQQLLNATPLTLDVPVNSIYYTDDLYFTFTPTMSGYYEFLVTYGDIIFSNIGIFTEEEWLNQHSLEDTEISLLEFLQAGTTYYIQFGMDAIYEAFTINVMNGANVAQMNVGVPETIADVENTTRMQFDPTSDGFYEFVIASNEEINTLLHVNDSEGKVIEDRYCYDDYSFYVEAKVGNPIFIEFFSGADPFTFTVNSADATEFVIGSPQTIPYDTDMQRYMFTLDHAGYYDLTITGAESSDYFYFYLYFTTNNDVLQADQFSIINGTYVASTYYLQPNVVYRLEISGMSVDSTFDLMLSAHPLQTLTTTNGITESFNTDETRYFEISIVDPGPYSLTYTSSTSLWFMQSIRSQSGEYILMNGYGDISNGNPYSEDLFLNPGIYYVEVLVNSAAGIDITLSEVMIEEVYVYQDIYVDLWSDTEYMVLFMPEVSGTYYIYSYEREMYSDPRVYITFNEDGYFSDDDGNGDLNFGLYEYFNAGVPYFIHFATWDETPGSYRAVIDFPGFD